LWAHLDRPDHGRECNFWPLCRWASCLIFSRSLYRLFSIFFRHPTSPFENECKRVGQLSHCFSLHLYSQFPFLLTSGLSGHEPSSVHRPAFEPCAGSRDFVTNFRPTCCKQAEDPDLRS
jgi:hypothetical protein